MAATTELRTGGYRYIPFAFQYSGGVAALDGYRIERVEFARPMPLAAGFAWIERYLGKLGVPLVAFCACELRSPAQFTDTGFIAFNRQYAGTLSDGASCRATTTRWRAATSFRPCDSLTNRAFMRSALRVRWPAHPGPSSSPAAARRGTAPRHTASARCVMAKRAPVRCGRRRVRAGADGGTDGRAWQVLVRHHGDAGLYGV